MPIFTHIYEKGRGGDSLPIKQVVSCTNKFQSKDEKERSENYTKKWINIINKLEESKIYKKHS